MRIAFVSSYPPTNCGIASYTQNLVEALRLLDPTLRVTMIAEMLPHDVSSTDRGRRLGFCTDDDYVVDLLRQVDRSEADVVHVQHEFGLFGMDRRFLDLLAGLQRRRVKTVVTLHSVHTHLSIDLGCAWWRGRPPMRDLDIETYQREMVELADHTIVHQELPIRDVLLRQGAPPDRVVTIPHGTRILPTPSREVSRRALGLDPGPPLVVSFGFFEPSKNLMTLLEAIALTKDEIADVKLWAGGYIRHPSPAVAGYRERCSQAVTRLGLKGSVIIADTPLPESRVPTLFGAADVACFIYDEDTRSSSGAAHTALGFGVAPVASRISKFSELAEVSDEILVDPNSPEETARLLIRLIQDDVFRHGIETSAQRFAARTSWDVVAKAHIRLYEERLLRYEDRDWSRKAETLVSG